MKSKSSKAFNFLFIAFFLILFEGVSFSQVSKGTFRLGPSLAYNSNTQEIDGFSSKFKSTTTTVQVSGGYFLINNLELSLQAQLNNTKSEVDSEDQTTSGTFIGPALTYMIPLTEKVYLPLTVGAGFNSLTIDDDFDEITLSGWGYGAGAGLEYIVENRLGARLSLIYNFGSLQDNDSDLEIDNSLFQASIGVNFYFNR